MRNFLLLMTIAGLTYQAAQAANVDEGLKKLNTDACLFFANTALKDPTAQINKDILRDYPKDVGSLPRYCSCVSDEYWRSVPQAEYDELRRSGKSISLQNKVESRMNTAKEICKKKFGL